MIEENRRSGIEPIMKYFSNSDESHLGSNVSINDDNIIIDGQKETMVTEKVSGEKGEKIIVP